MRAATSPPRRSWRGRHGSQEARRQEAPSFRRTTISPDLLALLRSVTAASSYDQRANSKRQSRIAGESGDQEAPSFRRTTISPDLLALLRSVTAASSHDQRATSERQSRIAGGQETGGAVI